MQMTPTQLRLYKEKVIREYRHKMETKKHQSSLPFIFTTRLRRLIPLNILVGLSAAIAYYFIHGGSALTETILSSIIWITLMSTIISAFLKK